jgi:hypothetical protein
MLEGIRQDTPLIPDMVISVAYISLISETPSCRWQIASQVMIEKGKGRYVEDLSIIQLCEADLNFVLHTIWGHQNEYDTP